MLRASLFETPLEEVPLQQNMLTVDLQLATIYLDIKFNDYEISRYASPKIGAISPHSFIAIWEDDLIHAELLKTKYNPFLPSQMKVTYSWAYIWRIKSKKNLSPLIFECCLNPKQLLLDKDIETGEGLFSKSFSFEEEYISIGTEDEDSLFQRADTSDHLPNRYVKEKIINYDDHNLVKSSDRGIKVHLPPLKAGELDQIQFVIAGGIDSTANWFAVDAKPRDILLQAGCR